MEDPCGVGSAFNLQSMLATRQLTMRLVNEAAAMCKPGMSEEQAHEILKNLFAIHKIEKTWHPSKIRFGRNTTKTFREISDSSVRLQESDIFYFDIGPVWAGHEGDFGRSFTLGADSEHKAIVQAASDVFEASAEIWRRQGLSGKALYQRAAKEARDRGYLLDERMDGHRVGDFPHALHWKKDLGVFEGVPAPNLWILEIHLLHPSGEYGAFFEDLLMT